MRILSAHRTPLEMVDYAGTAAERGLKVIIAGAGGAAHLPGMVASLTVLPVIGVPVKSKALSGVDSLYSIAQMPAGVPVATVAIGNGVNAGLLAVQILATADPPLAQPTAPIPGWPAGHGAGEGRAASAWHLTPFLPNRWRGAGCC